MKVRVPNGTALSEKARAPRSAIRFPAHRLLVGGESAQEFDAFRERVLAAVHLGNPISEVLAEQLVVLLWRLRRAPALEAGLLSWVEHQQSEAHDANGLTLAGHFFAADRRGVSPRDEKGQRHRAGRAVEAILVKSDSLGRLSRYEAHLVRQAERLLAELRRRSTL